MYSLPGMILLYLAVPFFTPKVFLDEIELTELIMRQARISYPAKIWKISKRYVRKNYKIGNM